MIAFFEQLLHNPYTTEPEFDLTDYTSWHICDFTPSDDGKEMRITAITIPFEKKHLMASDFHFPQEIGNMSRLEHLTINTSGSGCCKILPQLFNCPLKTLTLIGKKFYGPIPKEIANCAGTLETLTIADATLWAIPEEITELQKLRKLDFSFNHALKGEVPLFMRDFPDGVVDLSYCNYATMDDRFFTEEVGSIPNLYGNPLRLSDEIKQTQRYKDHIDRLSYYIL